MWTLLIDKVIVQIYNIGMEIFLGYLPWFWLALVVLFTLIEVFTFGLTTIWFALGSLLMVFLSPLPIPLVWQVLLFLVISSVLLVFTRPVAIRKLRVGRAKTNTDALLGAKALVIKDISELDRGLVRVNGMEWSALPSEGSSIARDSVCVIERIEGVTLYVRKINEVC